MLALALLAGLRGADHGRTALFVLPASWLIGGLVGLSATAPRSTALTCVSFLLLGGLLAADAKLSLRATTILAAIVGLFHGYLNGAGMGRPEHGGVALLGLIFAVFTLVADRGGFRCAVATPVGTYRCTRDGKLDCGLRSSDAGLGRARSLVVRGRPVSHISNEVGPVKSV